MAHLLRHFDAILDDLYAGTLDAELWERAMVGIAKSLDSSGVALLAFDPSRGVVLRDEGYGFEGLAEKSSRHREWLEWSPDPRFRPATRHPALKPMVEESLMPIREWRRSAMFNDLMRPIDCAYFLCTWLHKGNQRMVALSFQASERRGPFNADEQRQLQPLVPHISRALEIKERLEQRNLRNETLAASLDHAPFQLFILDIRGRLIEANSAAEAELCNASAIFRDKDGLVRLVGNADTELRKWILSGRPPENNRDGLIHVRRAGGQKLSILVTPVSGMSPTWTRDGPGWMLLVFDPETNPTPSLKLLAADLGLSARESQLAALLAQGNDLQEVAVRMGISPDTARAHIKSIFAKTGLHSQADLVRRVLRSPAAACPTRQATLQK